VRRSLYESAFERVLRENEELQSHLDNSREENRILVKHLLKRDAATRVAQVHEQQAKDDANRVRRLLQAIRHALGAERWRNTVRLAVSDDVESVETWLK
jgi:N-glycosylase/DNA lyase